MIDLRSPIPSFVAHFDMLGMRSAILRDTKSAWNALQKLLAAKEYVLDTPFSMASSGESLKGRVRQFIFSDTVILYTIGDSEQDVVAISVLAGELLARALAANIPLRGGIAHGEFMADDSVGLFTGPALIEAYILGEEAQWLGIVASDLVAERAAAVPLTFGNRNPLFVRSDVPRSPGPPVSRFVLDWPRLFSERFEEDPPISAELLYSDFGDLFGPWKMLPDDAKVKYRNTAAFINERLRPVASPRIPNSE